jgi:hydroxymethylglutaryl-CoA lyase
MSATDSHNRKNLNQTVAESMAELAPLAARARDDGLAARLSVSMVFGCPFEGDPGFDRIRAIVDRMAGHGFTRIGLCDTIGIASPQQVHDRVGRLTSEFAGLEFELHFHNTYGRGLANVLAGLQAGVTRFDSCVGGLGGCPFAPGATGNIATEDLVSMLDASGIRTGMALDSLLAASDFLDAQLDTRIQSNRWQVHNAQRGLRKAA